MTGQYTITERGGQPFITHGGIEYRADLKDGKLNLTMPAGEGVEVAMRFKKV